MKDACKICHVNAVLRSATRTDERATAKRWQDLGVHSCPPHTLIRGNYSFVPVYVRVFGSVIPAFSLRQVLVVIDRIPVVEIPKDETPIKLRNPKLWLPLVFVPVEERQKRDSRRASAPCWS